jgi:hypothetical protein
MVQGLGKQFLELALLRFLLLLLLVVHLFLVSGYRNRKVRMKTHF